MAWRSVNEEIHAYMCHLDSIMVNLRGITSFLSSFMDITKKNFWKENRRLCDPICLGEMRDTAHFQSCKSKEIWRYLVDHFGKKSVLNVNKNVIKYHAIWPKKLHCNKRINFLCRKGTTNVSKLKYFPRYWPFVRGIHRWPVNSPHKGQWRGALMFSLICVWTIGWVNNRDGRWFETPLRSW